MHVSAAAPLDATDELDPQPLRHLCRAAAVPCAWWSVRWMREQTEALQVRAGVVEAPRWVDDGGAMVTVVDRGGFGYAATADWSHGGLRLAFEQARDMAWAFARSPLFTVDGDQQPNPQGHYRGPSQAVWTQLPRRARLEQLLRWDASIAAAGSRVVDRQVQVAETLVDTVLVTSGGGLNAQRYGVIFPSLAAFASDGRDTQRRSFSDTVRQGGAELLDALHLDDVARRLGEEAVKLVLSPNCPTGPTTLVLAPDQMMLQIHESIGHPLELDRILGDERNFAGTSFVTPDMFGTYQYGSPLLNITFDPGVPGELASFAFDDEGSAAQRQYIIQAGTLLRPLGGATSQRRAGLAGVATTRASSWNRPPIDRMSNLNLEAGDLDDKALLAGVERGVHMQTNLSWSIDDSRNKFQFGCEVGQLIRDGELAGWVKNPSYRGISATFWRSLSGVGAARGVHGTPYCGKGEPSQIIRVGHASPTCRFDRVDVFGGEV